mgnify:CR=1 FL=1
MHRLKLNRIAPLMLTLLLTACVEVNSCPPTKFYSQEFRNTLADELVAMQDEYPNAVEAIIDLIVLREQCGP